MPHKDPAAAKAWRDEYHARPDIREQVRATGRRYRQSQKGKDSNRNAALLRMYGITLAEYKDILALQGGVCAICKNPPRVRKLHTDHDHETGEVRGILCMNCNRGIGYFGDHTQLLLNAFEYLRRSKEKVGK